MGKIGLLILLGFVAYAFWRTMNAVSRKSKERKSADSANGGGDPALERMVQCGRCGLHLPLAEALEGRGQQLGRFYCSAEHAQGSDQKD